MIIIEALFSRFILMFYGLLHSYGFAIILFTFMTKVVLFQASIWTHRSSLKMVALTPELNRQKMKYYDDKDIIA